MKRNAPVRTGGMLVLVLLAGTAAAEQIYRSVDAEGNVTFSNQPPADAVTVDEVSMQQGPSEAEQREARERLQRQQETAQALGDARVTRARQQEQAGSSTPETVEPVEPLNQYYGYPYANPPSRDKVRNRLPERPVQLPTRPVRPPARPTPR